MLIWVNGPFGGGKTATAHELVRRLDAGVERAVICDPEHVGFGLHRMLPLSLRGDFQDLPAWRRSVVEVLDLALRHYPGTVVAPMTLVDDGYFDEIIGGLRSRGHEVCHVALMARRETVVNRLRGRGLPGLKHEGFALAQIDRCLEALSASKFDTHVRTDERSLSQVADTIAELAGLPMRPDIEGPRRAWVRKKATSLRHMRHD